MQTKIPVMPFAVAGVQYRPADIIDGLTTGQEVRFTAEPTNEYDKYAIKIEAKFVDVVIDPENDESQTEVDIWKHIGYVPKKHTWIFHLLRQAGVKVFVKMNVNPAARPEDMLLIVTAIDGDPDIAFL